MDHPLLVAECLRKNAFPEDNERLLAAVVAVFAYDRDDEIQLATKELPHKLMAALRKMLLAVRPLSRRLESAGFVGAKLYTSAGVVMYNWAQGRNWDEVIKNTGIAEGDMASLIMRTADNLRQIAVAQRHASGSGSMRVSGKGGDPTGTGFIFVRLKVTKDKGTNGKIFTYHRFYSFR
ncbi:MAG: hypothetical protein MZV70_26455 [Desulfobacterales bacterium]|nr:hypothetical protein [Desulfobacterales bacterium]